MTLGELQRNMEEQLRTAGVAEAPLAVRLLLEERLGIAPLTLPLHRQDLIGSSKEEGLRKDLEELKAGRPLQYVLGTQAFCGLTLQVREGVLIPRPETEELADEAVKYLKTTGKKDVLDLCTGSGAIALAVKAKVPQASVTGSDLSEEALRIARENAQTLSLDVRWVRSDLLSGIGDTFDLIVCNPPYIPTGDVGTLDKNVRCFEPVMALDGGEDGLSVYRRLAEELPGHLKQDGALFMEVGIGQAEDVRELFSELFYDIKIRKDLEGVDRMVLGYGKKENA